MAFTTLPTYSTGDSVTAANWNTYIKNNFAAMPPDVFTATGEIFVGEGADTGGVLSPGVVGQPLIVATGETIGVKWSSTTVTSKFVFGRYSNDDYSGDDTFGGSSFLISVHDASGYNVPADAQMVLALLRVKWNAGSTDDYVVLGNTSDTDMEIMRIDYNEHYGANEITQNGFLPIAGGNISVEMSDSADVNFELRFTGYITS